MSNIEKIKAEIERLKGQLIRGACAAQIEMETNCKDEAYNEVLAFIDSLPEEHSFKPTQEHLDALDTVYKTHGADSACRHIILNLLNQLKELL